MSLLASAIATFCVSVPGQYNNACNSAMDAGTRQVGLRQQSDQLETVTKSKAETEVYSFLGPSKWVVGAGVFTAKVVKEKKVDFKLPDIGVADTISNTVTPKSYGLTFQWKF